MISDFNSFDYCFENCNFGTLPGFKLAQYENSWNSLFTIGTVTVNITKILIKENKMHYTPIRDNHLQELSTAGTMYTSTSDSSPAASSLGSSICKYKQGFG